MTLRSPLTTLRAPFELPDMFRALSRLQERTAITRISGSIFFIAVSLDQKRTYPYVAFGI
jgi:hypothetical protein